MASPVESDQECSNRLAIVPYCPVVLHVEPVSTNSNSCVSVPLTSTYEVNDVNNNEILEPIPISLYDPGSRSSQKGKLRTSKVLDISYNNKFRRVFRGDHIEYMWERDGPTANTIPMIDNDGFTHELLQDWVVETRIRQNGYTTERYFTHPQVKRQFRSIKSVEEFLATNLSNQQTIEEMKAANKLKVERFLAESYENLMNYNGTYF